MRVREPSSAQALGRASLKTKSSRLERSFLACKVSSEVIEVASAFRAAS